MLFYVILGEVVVYLIFTVVIGFLIFPVKDVVKESKYIVEKLDARTRDFEEIKAKEDNILSQLNDCQVIYEETDN